MIIVTGGAGFIGSALLWKLNEKGLDDIVVVDRLGTEGKWKNLAKRQLKEMVHKDAFQSWLEALPRSTKIEAIFHLGACSSTTELDMDYLNENNIRYSMHLWNYAAKNKIPFIYASSAATYGAGEHGYSDQPKGLAHLRPINKYGYSKHFFDLWVQKQKQQPPFWCGLKFFNVYGPQEYHKKGQASVVFHAYNQIGATGSLKLFKSYHPKYEHGEQMRDFVYIKDVVDVLYHLYVANTVAVSGIYNLGSGKARTFADLGRGVFTAMNKRKPILQWIDMPDSLQGQYQYFTEADLQCLRQKTGYKGKMHTLEDGIKDYVQKYLATKDPYL
jgi:ADP-L-glycero-D-manno-heptose 6-epimerase